MGTVVHCYMETAVSGLVHGYSSHQYVCVCEQVNWHDFAFFDPVMYESLRQLIRHSQAGEAEAVFAAMDVAFAIDLCKEEGAGQVKNSQGEYFTCGQLNSGSALKIRFQSRFFISLYFCNRLTACSGFNALCHNWHFTVLVHATLNI